MATVPLTHYHNYSNTSVAYSPVSYSHELLFSSPILLRWSSRSLHVCPKQLVLFIIGQYSSSIETKQRVKIHYTINIKWDRGASSGKGKGHTICIYIYDLQPLFETHACMQEYCLTQLPIRMSHIKQPINATHFICVRLFGVLELTLLFALVNSSFYKPQARAC